MKNLDILKGSNMTYISSSELEIVKQTPDSSG